MPVLSFEGSGRESTGASAEGDRSTDSEGGANELTGSEGSCGDDGPGGAHKTMARLAVGDNNGDHCGDEGRIVARWAEDKRKEEVIVRGGCSVGDEPRPRFVQLMATPAPAPHVGAGNKSRRGAAKPWVR